MFMLPSIHFCRLNLLIILNQNLPISDENDFGKIRLSYTECVHSIYSMKSTCNQQFIIKFKPFHVFYNCTC